MFWLPPLGTNWIFFLLWMTLNSFRNFALCFTCSRNPNLSGIAVVDFLFCFSSGLLVWRWLPRLLMMGHAGCDPSHQAPDRRGRTQTSVSLSGLEYFYHVRGLTCPYYVHAFSCLVWLAWLSSVIDLKWLKCTCQKSLRVCFPVVKKVTQSRTD